MKDRTAEFQASIESYIQRPSSEPLLAVRGKTANGAAVSPFMKMAAQLGSDINLVSTKLERLATLARNKSSFEDRPVEIQELTFVIKQDISRLNQQIAALEQYKKEQRAILSANRQSEEHNNSVVVSLQSKLANASSSFKDILEVRTSNMQAQRERRQQFSSSATSALLPDLGSSSADRASPVVIDMGTSLSQMQIVRQDTRYLEARSEAIQNIESTISELGSIFQQLAHMVAEQGEMVGRIDADIENVSFNVEQGEQQLLQYLRRISNDRWTMIKAFAIVIFFFVIFTAFFS